MKTLTNNEKKLISENIRYDCDPVFSHIYDNFPRLKKHLLYIAQKLVNSCYCVNADELTENLLI